MAANSGPHVGQPIGRPGMGARGIAIRTNVQRHRGPRARVEGISAGACRRSRSTQVVGFNAILDEWERRKLKNLRWLAYMLATGWHETATRMEPVIESRQPKEASNPPVDEAIARLERAWKAGKMPWVKSAYWRKDAAGRSYLGRGLPQITHADNYRKLGKRIGVDLVSAPDRLLAHVRRWKRPGLSKNYVVEYQGRPVGQVNKGFAAAVESAALKGTPYTLRHTCATWAMQRGARGTPPTISACRRRSCCRPAATGTRTTSRWNGSRSGLLVPAVLIPGGPHDDHGQTDAADASEAGHQIR
jgi:hypothetical protein